MYILKSVNLNARAFRPEQNNYKHWLMRGYMTDRARLIKWLQAHRYTADALVYSLIKRELVTISNRLRDLYREAA